MTPRALLDAAEALLDDASDLLPGAWPRAVALLVRQALEAQVDREVPPELARAPFTVRLLWLRGRGDPDRAERLAATWSALSEACHFHGYELPPTTSTLRGWIRVVGAACGESEVRVSGALPRARLGRGEHPSGGGVDEVQADLIAWREGDRERGERALRAISAEWRGRVRHYLRSPPAEEVEDVLSEAMIELCMLERLRVLAPDDARSPKAWRAAVLRNFLHDRRRRLDRRQHAEWASALGLGKAQERAAWRGDVPRLVAAPVAPVVDEVTDPLERLIGERRRAEVVRRAHGLAVRRGVLVLLALRADVEPRVAELARALGDTVERVSERVRRARASADDARHGYLTLAMVRVVYPDEPEQKALEAARKALSRALLDLQAACAESA